MGLDAPDKNNCLGQEATDLLTNLILNKHVWLEEKTRDDYGRTLAVVFVYRFLSLRVPRSGTWQSTSSINEELVKKGLATFSYSTGKYNKVIKIALEQAKNQRLGVYSDKCRSNIPPDANCLIKGNIDQSSKKKFYHLPSCLHYKEVILNTAFGEKWFCLESEAQKAGFTKAFGC